MKPQREQALERISNFKVHDLRCQIMPTLRFDILKYYLQFDGSRDIVILVIVCMFNWYVLVVLGERLWQSATTSYGIFLSIET